MTRRRRVPLVLRVCIGVVVLLFSTVTADTTKSPPDSEQLTTDALPESLILQNNKTNVNQKVSSNSSGESQLALTENRNESVASIQDSIKRDEKDEFIKDAKAEDEEKVSMPTDEDSEQQSGIRSRESQVDRLSTADSANGGSKLEEIIYGTSGKSSSTKTLSEDFYRNSRNNGLTSVTTKPSFEDSKVDEKKNKTIQRPNDTPRAELSNKTAKLVSHDSEPKQESRLNNRTNFDTEKSSKESVANLHLETVNVTNDSGAEKVRFPEEFQERRKKSEKLSSAKNSEVPDLKEADNDGSISLINDTNVNYSNRYKTTTEKNPEASQSKNIDNATNFISEEAKASHESNDPKGDVEVVGNVTDSVIQRIVDGENSTPKDSDLANELSQRSNRDEDSSRNSTKVAESRVIEKQEQTSEKNQQKVSQVTTERANYETSTPQGASSPVPRGRTIAFSEINEFPSLEAKPTLASKLDVSFSKRNLTDKPNPYTKSLIKEQLNNSNQVDITTEEVSALENTIGKGQSEEKFIVTEASDVLENSIQQFKPSYYEKANESSTISSIEVRSSLPMTTMSLVRSQEVIPTNRTAMERLAEPKGIAEPEKKSTSIGNDVPRWSESREAITGNFDVTGNGITEVSLKPETGDKRSNEASSSFQEIAARTTPIPLTTDSMEPQTDLGMLSNVDVQTNAAGSLLLRSTLNASEISTQYPLIKGNFSDREKSTVPPTTVFDTTTLLPPTTIEETFIGNVTEPPVASDANGTNEIPSAVSGAFTSEENLPITTTIQYEFVGLSESTTILSRNVTGDEHVEGRESPYESSGVPTVHDLPIRNTSNEATTVINDLATSSDNSSVGSEVDATNVSTTDQTIAPTFVRSPTTQFTIEFTTQSSAIEEESSTKVEEALKTIGVTDSWTTTSETLLTTIKTEHTISRDSKDFMGNVTESPVEFASISSVNATDATRVATSIPFVPSSLRPRIPVSSSVSTPTASDIPSEKTYDTKLSPTNEEITALVRIDMEGNWYDICPKMDKLKTTLAEILSSGMDKPITDKHIIYHQDPCQKSPSSTPSPSDVPMMSILVYVLNDNGKFDRNMTTILPSLYAKCQDRVTFPVKIHRFLLQETISDSGNAIAVVVVSAVAFICLVLLAGLLFIMRKRQTRFNYGERCRPVSLDAYSLDSVSAYNSVRRKGVARSSKRSYGNPTFEDSSAIPSHPLNFVGLSSFCNDVNAINEEFSGIPQVSAKIDELPTGAEVKNRYANVIPLPETRVPLQKINNDPLTEYINASYVRGPKNATRYYIACQAPMESTVTDFWRMIWEQQSKVIIMLTDLVENGVEKCTEYVPPSEITDCHRLYGDYQVTLKKRETKEKYAISTLHLKNLESNTFREVYHMWYLWPVDGAQSDGAGLIAVLLEARALQRGGPGPIVVHCSPGTGRTGTLIALDLGLRQYEITRTVDVPRVVYTIRRDRAGAVQTKEQYAFIYKALNLYATRLAGGGLEST